MLSFKYMDNQFIFIMYRVKSNKRFGILMLVCFIVGMAFIAPVSAFSGAGDGTAGDPYQITTRAQLEEISSALSASYILMNDIDLGGSSTPWTPIGTSVVPFTGTLDGDGHIISNLYYSGSGDSKSLIGVISGGEIQHLGGCWCACCYVIGICWGHCRICNYWN